MGLDSLSVFLVLIFTPSLSISSFYSSPLNTGCPICSHQNTKTNNWKKKSKTSVYPSALQLLPLLSPPFPKILSPVCLPPALKQPSPRSPVSDIFAAKSTFQSPSYCLCLKHLTTPSLSPLATMTLGFLVWFPYYWLLHPITHSTKSYSVIEHLPPVRDGHLRCE